ncbi:hypothetical protein B0H14DRAFT_2600605 [Mycena olivaceomarginata]|nr:hypothetical protein B0H14DRAFT_2600605 [Mycena olivaceomarginata]
MPYIHAGSSVMYPSMPTMPMGSVVLPSYGHAYPSHPVHHSHGHRRHSSSGSYYGLPTQHDYPNYAYGGGYYGLGGNYGYGGGYSGSHSHSHSRAPAVIVTHGHDHGHGHRRSSRSSSWHRSGFLGYL